MQKPLHEYSWNSQNWRKWFSVSFVFFFFLKRTVVDSDSRRKGQTVGKPYCLVESRWHYCVKEMPSQGFCMLCLLFIFWTFSKQISVDQGLQVGKGVIVKEYYKGFFGMMVIHGSIYMLYLTESYTQSKKSPF